MSSSVAYFISLSLVCSCYFNLCISLLNFNWVSNECILCSICFSFDSRLDWSVPEVVLWFRAWYEMFRSTYWVSDEGENTWFSFPEVDSVLRQAGGRPLIRRPWDKFRFNSLGLAWISVELTALNGQLYKSLSIESVYFSPELGALPCPFRLSLLWIVSSCNSLLWDRLYLSLKKAGVCLNWSV